MRKEGNVEEIGRSELMEEFVCLVKELQICVSCFKNILILVVRIVVFFFVIYFRIFVFKVVDLF